LTLRPYCAKIIITCGKGLNFHAFLRFPTQENNSISEAGRQSVSPAEAGSDTNNKEVPLDARKSHFEMQRVQAEKLQYDEEQEKHPG
jgi:hypothetical protein